MGRIWVSLVDGPYAGERTQREVDDSGVPAEEFRFTKAQDGPIGGEIETMPLSTYRRGERKNGVWQYHCTSSGRLG